MHRRQQGTRENVAFVCSWRAPDLSQVPYWRDWRTRRLVHLISDFAGLCNKGGSQDSSSPAKPLIAVPEMLRKL
jgi:hypothetical protein